MITLSRHIEILLLDHDCVIIPGLGGFIANQVSSRYSDNGDNLFLPPYRTIGFNQQLSINDGLLVQSYMQAYDAAYPEACLQMEKDINELIIQLDVNGSYTLNGIGTLTKSIENGITFTAPEAGILTPSLYGLYSVEVKNLDAVKQEKEIQKAISQTSVLPIQRESEVIAAANNSSENVNNNKTSEESISKNNNNNNSKEITIRLHKKWMEFSAAAAAAVILFFLFTFPSLKSEDKMSDTCVASTVYVGKPEDLPKNPIANKKKYSNSNSSTTIAVKNEQKQNLNAVNNTTTTKKEADNKEKKDYVIVLASRVSSKNAKLFIDNLSAQGFKEARLIKDGKNRVVYSAYATYSDAYNALQELNKQNPAFSEAWVLHINN
ncbi:MAG: SPOR domain-containing protein [Bacteroidaceae bacterium]|nr:SPOR domain-containing protein [Bacteroidaceae bacterium]